MTLRPVPGGVRACARIACVQSTYSRTDWEHEAAGCRFSLFFVFSGPGLPRIRAGVTGSLTGQRKGRAGTVAIRFIRERKTDYIWIIAGTLLMALATNLFYSPANMIPGGFTGLAIILQHVTRPVIAGGLPLWLGNLILNIPLLLVSIRIRGWRFVLKTLLATGVFSLWLFLIPEYALAADDLFLTAVIGGALMGAGLGFVFLGKATTGGTDTVAAILQRALPHVNTARIMPVLDGVIILLSIWIFGIRISLYAVVTVVLNGRIADAITTGFRNSSMAYIVSDRYEEISEAVTREIKRGATLLKGKGAYTGTDRPVLMVAVSKRQAPLLKEIVSEIDADAFMIVTDASEIRGEGFLQFTKDEV